MTSSSLALIIALTVSGAAYGKVPSTNKPSVPRLRNDAPNLRDSRFGVTWGDRSEGGLPSLRSRSINAQR